MKRIWIILKKDLKEYWILPLIFAIIPIIVFYMPIYGEGKEIVVGVYGELESDYPFVAENISDIEQGIKQVKRGEVDAFYVETERKLYGNIKEKEKTELLLYLLSDIEGDIKEISMGDSIQFKNLYLPLLCIMSLIMTGFIGAPITILSEKEDNTLQALLSSPLSYRNFVLEKAFFGFLISFIAVLIFLLVTGWTGDFIGIIIVLILASFFFSLIAVIFGIYFSDLEKMFAFITPLLLIILFVEVYSSFHNYSLELPISRALYKLMVLNKFPIIEMILIGAGCVVLIIFDSYLVRRLYKRK